MLCKYERMPRTVLRRAVDRTRKRFCYILNEYSTVPPSIVRLSCMLWSKAAPTVGRDAISAPTRETRIDAA